MQSTKVTTSLSTASGTKLTGGDSSNPPLVAPDAGTDSGTWSTGAQTLAGVAATGGVAPITYLWTVQSGPNAGSGTGTFSDDTALDSTFAPDLPGVYVLKLTATDAVMQTASDTVTLAWTPAVLLGSSLIFADYCAAHTSNLSAVNPYITIGTGVSSWPEEASRNGAFAQGTTTRQPALSATSFNGWPGITADGSNDGLFAILNPTIATGSRLYMWILGKWTTTSIGKDYARILELSATAPATDSNVSFISSTDASNKFGGFSSLSDGTDDAAGVSSNGATMTTDAQLWEYGLINSTTGKLVVNGSATDGTVSGTTVTTTFSRAAMFYRLTDVLQAPACIHRVVIAHNTSSITALPSASQLAEMRILLSKMTA